MIDVVGVQRKDFMAVLLVLHSDRELRRVVAKLDYWTDEKHGDAGKKSSLDVVQIMFEKGHETCSQKVMIRENVQYAVLFGKFHIFHPPLNVMNKEIKSSLKEVISKITPPSAKVALVQTGRQGIIKIHSEEKKNSCSFSYFAPKLSLEKMMLHRSLLVQADEPNKDIVRVIDDPSDNPTNEEEQVDEHKCEGQNIERRSSTSKF